MVKSFISLVLVAVIGGCCACGTSSTHDSSPSADQASYDITIGSGGGVTGNITGIHIAPSGEVTAWSALANQDAAPEYFGRMPQDRLTLLYTIIDEDSLMHFDYAETGNMTSFLTLKGRGDIHRVRWSGIETDTVAAPIPLRRFIDAMNKAYKVIEKP